MNLAEMTEPELRAELIRLGGDAKGHIGRGKLVERIIKATPVYADVCYVEKCRMFKGML